MSTGKGGCGLRIERETGMKDGGVGGAGFGPRGYWEGRFQGVNVENGGRRGFGGILGQGGFKLGPVGRWGMALS